MSDEHKFEAGGFAFEMEGLADGLNFRASSLAIEDGLTHAVIALTSDEPIIPTKATLRWQMPMDRVHFKWNPSCYRHRFLDVMNDCRNRFSSRAIDSAPVMSVYDIGGQNTLTFALSDAMYENELGISVGEDGFLKCSVSLFCEPWDPITSYSVVIRIDRRPLPLHLCLREVASWWIDCGIGPPAPVPESARVPTYCTWYSCHGQVTAGEVEKQAALAKDLGMDVVLIDAGWGHGSAGVAEEKFPDMPGLVRKVHDLGMKLMLWTSPSATEDVSRERFKDELLVSPKTGKARLDVRYPDVREYILDYFPRMIDAFDADGFKIDFISSFGKVPEDDPDDPRRDHKSISVAVDRLLADLTAALRKRKPELPIEFRQSYVGPHMIRYANMLRAVDCGNCFADNRVRVLDIRMLSGSTPAFADPIMWNPTEPVESAALQFIHTLFAVPEVSVKIDELPRDHIDMLRCYLSFWREHRDVLLDGDLTPYAPQDGFPVVCSATRDKFLAVVHGNAVVPLPDEDAPPTVILVNGTYADQVVVRAPAELGLWEQRTVSCTGRELEYHQLALSPGVRALDVPRCAYAVLTRQTGDE